jgi:hypothetical protein
MIEKRKQIQTIHGIAPVYLKDEGGIEALLTVYSALMVPAQIVRGLRNAMQRDHIDELNQIYNNCELAFV